MKIRENTNSIEASAELKLLMSDKDRKRLLKGLDEAFASTIFTSDAGFKALTELQKVLTEFKR